MTETITAETMQRKGKLLDASEVRERLAASEPLTTVDLSGAKFRLDELWLLDVDGKRGDDATGGYVTVRGKEYRLTKDAALEVTSKVGIPKSYAAKTPGRLVEPHLDYWYDSPDRHLKLVVSGDRATGVAKGSYVPFSNLNLLDRTLAAVERRYGKGEVLVDGKYTHSLERTSLFVVVPEARRAMRPGDVWSGGVQVTNSLLGEVATVINGYLFRWWCTNGAITQHRSSGTYKRRSAAGETQEDMYDWAARSVDAVLGHLEGEFDRVEAMTTVPIQGEVNAVLTNVFEEYRLPQVQREAIRNEMVESADLTTYGLMQAVTRAANAGGLSARTREQLMTIGGDLVRTGGRCDSCHQVVVAQHGHD